MTNTDTDFTIGTVDGDTRATYSTPVAMDIDGRTVFVYHFSTAHQYSTPQSTWYWFTGYYAKKDGTPSKVGANNLTGAHSIPANVLAALNA